MERVYQNVYQGDYGDDSLDFGKMMKMVQKGKEQFLPQIQDFLNEHIPEDLKTMAKDKAKEFAPKIQDLTDKAKEFLPKIRDLTDKAKEFLTKKADETKGEVKDYSNGRRQECWPWWMCGHRPPTPPVG